MWENEGMNKLYHDICTILALTQRRMVISHRQAVSKRPYGIAILQYVKFQKSADVISISAEVWNDTECTISTFS
jgi:hypothetical protein